jgi:hypothetical protein
MVDLDQLSFEQAREDIYAEVASSTEAATYPADTVYHIVAGSVRIVFVIHFGLADGSQFARPITDEDIQRWRITKANLVESFDCTNIAPVKEWNRISKCGRAFCYPFFSRDWTGLLLRPNELGEKVNVKGLPLLMIPFAEMVLISGSNDLWGIRAMLSHCLASTAEPITRRPLILESDEWIEFDDPRNPARKTFQRRLGLQ